MVTKKLGPLPIWAWGLILGVGGYFLYERYVSGSSSSSSSGTTGILDPNAVDPNTGLTYGQEEADAMNANASLAGGGGSTGAVPTDSGAQSTVPDIGTEIGDVTGLISSLETAGLIATPNATSSDTTAAAADSPPVQGSSPPTTTATSHTSAQIDTHPGGPFYNWYVQVYGKAPAQHLASNSTAYTLWKSGVKASVAKATVGTGKAKTAVTNAAKAANPTKPNTNSSNPSRGVGSQTNKPKKAKPKPHKVKGP